MCSVIDSPIVFCTALQHLNKWFVGNGGSPCNMTRCVLVYGNLRRLALVIAKYLNSIGVTILLLRSSESTSQTFACFSHDSGYVLAYGH